MIDILQKMLGQSLAASVAVLVAIFLVRKSVAKAVELAGQKELERLKAQLSGDLEVKRQEFARDLEHHRATAARDLEQFKAELSLDAEVRRQVAAKKVEAVLEIASLGEPLIRFVMNASPDDRHKRAEASMKISEYIMRIRDLAHLFEERTAAGLRAHANKMNRADGLREGGKLNDASVLANEAYDELLDLVRTELGVKYPSNKQEIIAATPPSAAR